MAETLRKLYQNGKTGDAAETAGTAEAGDAQADAAEAVEAAAEEAPVQGAEEASHRRRNK